MASSSFSASAQRFGVTAAFGTVGVAVAYVVMLLAGLVALPSPDLPIADPWFSILEGLILLIAPMMVALIAGVHAWAPDESKVFATLSLIFMSLMAAVTCSVHFVILVLGHQSALVKLEWAPALLSFNWPSIPYALDILAWDIFFPLSALAAAAVFGSGQLEVWIRSLLIGSGVLAFAGLAGLFLGNMQFRNIGVVGYAGVFPVAAFALARLLAARREITDAATVR